MEYYTKAVEILDSKIKKDKIEHLIGKHTVVYETCIKAIMEALVLKDKTPKDEFITFLMKVGDCYGMEDRKKAEICVNEIMRNDFN